MGTVQKSPPPRFPFHVSVITVCWTPSIGVRTAECLSFLRCLPNRCLENGLPLLFVAIPAFGRHVTILCFQVSSFCVFSNKNLTRKFYVHVICPGRLIVPVWLFRRCPIWGRVKTTELRHFYSFLVGPDIPLRVLGIVAGSKSKWGPNTMQTAEAFKAILC
jgi:hypothetical protein